MAWIRYIGPEPRVSFAAASNWSEAGLEPFVKRMEPVEVTKDVAESRCYTTITVPDAQGVPQPVKRPGGEWEECGPPSDVEFQPAFEFPKSVAEKVEAKEAVERKKRARAKAAVTRKAPAKKKAKE